MKKIYFVIGNALLITSFFLSIDRNLLGAVLPVWVSILTGIVGLLFLGIDRYKNGKLKSFAGVVVAYALILAVMVFIEFNRN